MKKSTFTDFIIDQNVVNKIKNKTDWFNQANQHNPNQIKIPACINKLVFNQTIVKNNFNYSASETTSVTSGTIRFNRFSIPDFSVMVDDGQPLHEPLSSTVTTPSLNDL
jgi:hypothetical protein